MLVDAAKTAGANSALMATVLDTGKAPLVRA